MKKINLAENLKIYRMRNKITQGELAQKLMVKQSTISSWETGVSVPDIYTLIELTEILNTSLIELIGEKETDNYLPEIRNYNQKKIIDRFGHNRIKFLQHRLDLLTDDELDDIELALTVLEERRKKNEQKGKID
ncbi:helix-turn-helix domain-containing protein [Turicibacter bilis]|uniref:helix-turn-helix domain-containing protein n=1 Tax=Turicibacter bilis TaxID=2735723 RepID=UPI001BB0B04E|nr:helix-turn-helix transcriptional regulator [Turicibacter bilis]MBS3199014.1 helix-turn-helix transcriptional regulator [Turicibacter bilis]